MLHLFGDVFCYFCNRIGRWGERCWWGWRRACWLCRRRRWWWRTRWLGWRRRRWAWRLGRLRGRRWWWLWRASLWWHVWHTVRVTIWQRVRTWLGGASTLRRHARLTAECDNVHHARLSLLSVGIASFKHILHQLVNLAVVILSGC